MACLSKALVTKLWEHVRVRFRPTKIIIQSYSPTDATNTLTIVTQLSVESIRTLALVAGPVYYTCSPVLARIWITRICKKLKHKEVNEVK